MPYHRCFLSLLFITILELFCVPYASASWPSSDSSGIQLLGLFGRPADVSNFSDFVNDTRAMFQAAILLSHEYNITIEGKFIGWQIAQTIGEAIDTLSSTCSAVSSGKVVGIVGPVYSREAEVIAAYANRIGIPAISYSATSPELTDRFAYPAFFRTVPSDDIAALSIVQLFRKFNWTSSIIIYQNDAFGTGGVKAIGRAFNQYGLTVYQTLAFDIARLEIQGDLKSCLLGSPPRIVILWADSMYTSLVIQSALDLDLVGPQFTWILSVPLDLNSFNQTFASKLIGIITIEPTVAGILDKSINQTLLDAAYNIWQKYEPSTFPGAEKVNNYALFAFDATWSLILALQKLCSTNVNYTFSCTSFIHSPSCYDKRFINAKYFVDSVINTTFLGVSGIVRFSENVTNRISGSYYWMQNVQYTLNILDYVPVLQWSNSENWRTLKQPNAIVWSGNSLIPPSGFAKLSNLTLRIGVTLSIPFTMISNLVDDYGQPATKLIGYALDLIDLLQDKMGFIPNITLAPTNVTYAGLVDAVAAGVYDIVVADTTITSARRQKAEFTSSIFDNALRIMMRKKTVPVVDLIAYLKPFSFNLWMVLLGSSIMAAFLICVLERAENRMLNDRSVVSSITMSWWYTIGTIMGYGVDFHVETAAGRLLTVGLYLTSLVLVATYTANLASELTISKVKGSIDGIADIKNGKIPFSRVGVRVGTASEEYYLHEISGGIKNYYPLQSRQHMYDALLDNLIDVSFMDSGTAEYITNNIYCNLTLVGAEFDKTSLAIVIPKNWLYAQELDVNILQLREKGVLDSLRAKWFQTSTCAANGEDPGGMAVETMSGLFLTFGVVCALSLILFLWTKRCAVKGYVLKLAGRNDSSSKKNTMVTIIEPRKGSQNNQANLSHKVRF